MREFKKRFTWNPRDEDEIKKSFDHKGMCIIKNATNKLRAGKTKGSRIETHIREQLEAYFATEEFQQRSAIGWHNPAVKCGASAYTGGSVSAGEHFDRMEQGRPPTAIER